MNTAVSAAQFPVWTKIGSTWPQAGGIWVPPKRTFTA